MIEEKLTSLLKSIDGILLIDLGEPCLGNCWSNESTNFYLLNELTKAAKETRTHLFVNKSRANIINDYDFFRKLDLTKDWNNLKEFQYEDIANTVEDVIKKPREEITLGFGGALSISCVRKHLHALCDEKIESDNPEKKIVNVQNLEIKNQFGKGILLYELTEDKDLSFFGDREIKNYLTNKYNLFQEKY